MKFNKGLLGLLAAGAVTLGLVACEDQPDKYEVTGGVPSISYIRPANAASADSLLTAASTGQSLCIVGENLRSICEMYFNDRPAVLNSSYITDNVMFVSVPQDIPGEVSNKIYMVTQSNDTVDYDFTITVPGPTIFAMSCEYAPAGSTVTVTGNYFIDDPNVPLELVFADGTSVTNFTSFTQSSITFVMPEVSVEGPITVNTVYGSDESTFHYLDSRGIMFDFDGLTGLGNHGWHNRDIISDETSLTGNFLLLGGATLDAEGGWNDGNFAFEYWAGSWNTPTDYPEREGIRLFDLVDFSKYNDMALKFEMYIPSSNPWSSGAMQVIFAGTDKVSMGNAGTDIYGNTVPGCNNTFFQDDVLPRALYRPWTDTGSYDTGDEWVTVTLPISSSFIYGFTGAMASGLLTEEDFASLTIFVVGGGISGTECNPIIKIDNIRAVPN